MRLVDSRRLTGPNLYAGGPGAIAEVEWEPGDEPARALAAWQEAIEPYLTTTSVVVPVGLAYPAALPLALLDADDVGALLPTPPPVSDKYTRGVVGVLAGSDQYPGAAVLCAGGAVRGGAGYVRYLGPDLGGTAAAAVRGSWPTVVERLMPS